MEIADYWKKVLSLKTREVSYPGWDISENPLVSRGYFDCVGVALLETNVAGLSHFNFCQPNPLRYLSDFLDSFRDFSGDSPVSAVVVGGDILHTRMARSFLLQEGVIVENYRPNKKEDLVVRSLVVVPSDKRVVMRRGVREYRCLF